MIPGCPREPGLETQALSASTTVAVSGVDEALQRLAEEPFDLVLADELMPDARRLGPSRRRCAPIRATRALPFILLSLFGAEHDTADREYRPDAIGLKPIRAALLAKLVDQVSPARRRTHPAPRPAPQVAADVPRHQDPLGRGQSGQSARGAATAAETGRRRDHRQQRRRSLGAHRRARLRCAC